MYFGIGDKSDPNAQQGQHIRDSRIPDRNAPPPPPPSAKESMHKDVMAFTRKLQYDNLVRAGVTPPNAIRQVVPSVKSGIMLTPKDIQNVIETGKVRKSRVG